MSYGQWFLVVWFWLESFHFCLRDHDLYGRYVFMFHFFSVLKSILSVLLLSNYIFPLENDRPSTILYSEIFVLKVSCVFVVLRSFCGELVLVFLFIILRGLHLSIPCYICVFQLLLSSYLNVCCLSDWMWLIHWLWIFKTSLYIIVFFLISLSCQHDVA